MEREAARWGSIKGRVPETEKRSLLPRWRPDQRHVTIAIGVVIALMAGLLIAYLVSAALGMTLREAWGALGMVPSDWMKLLIIPLILAIAGPGFAWALEKREGMVQEREMAVAAERVQYEILVKCIDQTKNLLLDYKLHDKNPEDGVSKVARACALTGFRHLDPSRKRALFLFLCESDLIQKGDKRVIKLDGAELCDIDLGGCQGPGSVDLSGAIMTGADLRETNLEGADLSGADLRGADLHGTNLAGADLSNATLSITQQELEQQASSLQGATMPNGSKHD